MQVCPFVCVCVWWWGAHLCATHADDAVDAAAGIVEERHGDGVFAGRQPVAFGGRVDLKDMSFGAEDGLLPVKKTKQNRQTKNKRINSNMCKLPTLNKSEFDITSNELGFLEMSINICIYIQLWIRCNLYVKFGT